MSEKTQPRFIGALGLLEDGRTLLNVRAAALDHVVSVHDVRAEAARRMRSLVEARDDRHLDIIITNNLREMARLLQKQVAGETLTPEEEARKQKLRRLDATIEAIRAASNRLEAKNPIPDAFSDDRWWP